jgi:hypothetical protein
VKLWKAFAKRIGTSEPNLRDTVLAVSRIPYGRPSNLSAEGVVQEWRGTCSTKHLLLLALMMECWPDMEPRLWHRVYRVTPEHALATWGGPVARTVPPDGLVDVHTFVTAHLAGASVTLDATFAVDEWDGRSAMPIWAAPGDDISAGFHPLDAKRALEREHCDPAVREPFIAALVMAEELRSKR